ncbi:PT domain-containing protein [Streptomyces sp. NPDC056670]|uniref:PT domain-containing protein n=1 Tax=Streptomyces sp. NPDC056670 TaxID=3345904 RepID=UPI0036934801
MPDQHLPPPAEGPTTPALTGREPPGYQRAPHYGLIVGCGVAAVVLAVCGAVVNFGPNLDPKSPTLPTRPSGLPSGFPTSLPSGYPTGLPTGLPSGFPTSLPSDYPTGIPTGLPTGLPSSLPSDLPTDYPTDLPTGQ